MRQTTFSLFAVTLLLCLLSLGQMGCQASKREIPAPAAGLAAANLRSEYLANPLGIDETTPRLSWVVQSKERGQFQTACQVLVASDESTLGRDSGDLWDSGKVLTDNTTDIVYSGRALKSGQRCYWKVKVWDKNDKASAWSKPAFWSIGLKEGDWRCEWIGYDKMRASDHRVAPFEDAKWIWFAGDQGPDFPKCHRAFMTTMNIPDAVGIAKAELLVAADDRIWFNINGGQAQMSHSCPFGIARQVDVTALVKPGANKIRAQVENKEKGAAGLIAKLTVTTTDGKTFKLVTDGSWRSTKSNGEDWLNHPAEEPGWTDCQVIGPAGCKPWGKLTYTVLTLPPPSYLRASFGIAKPVKRATIYASALGIFDLHLNGRRVSEDRFSPGWTDYSKRAYYRTYDVTKLLQKGENALGTILADGWYSGYIGWGQIRSHYGSKPRFRGQLQIEYADGTTEIVASDAAWKASRGPLQEADLLMGETFDARRVQDGWDKPGFDSSKWDSVVVGGAEQKPLTQSHPGTAVLPFAEIKAQQITEPKKGVYIVNLGQNFAGVARLKVSGEPGQKITLRFAERLNPDGTIYTVNLRGARATDTYICRGGGVETWEPRFTFHGFQYVEITGLKKAPAEDTVTGIALSSATPVVGSFTCSDPMLNRLQKNGYWTQRANFIDVPTDCPQRDERLGWTGDAQVYIRTATLNADVQAFFTKWLVDLEDGQRADGQFPMVAPLKVAGDDGGPAWADAGVICPWTIYEVYGDKRILARHYDSMVRFIEFCKNRATPDLLPPKDFHCFGDWLNIKAETPKEVIYTAYFAYSTKLVARSAEILGKQGDAAKYNELFAQIKATFNRAYVAPDGRIKGDTQAGYVLALSFDLLDPEKEKLAAQYLVEDIKSRDWHLSTGFIGTKSLMLALAKIGRNDVAFRLVHNDTFPSWGFSIKQGATSIWERWDGWTPEKGFQDPGMNSFAHYSFGAVYQWMAENIGGIQSDSVAYKHIVIAPQSDGKVTSAETAYNSIRGPIKTEWKRNSGAFSLSVSIPANTTATVHLPAKDAKAVFESGKLAAQAQGVRFLRMENGCAVFEIVSGTYAFESK